MTILGRGPIAIIAAILCAALAVLILAAPLIAKGYNLAPWARRAVVMTAIGFAICAAVSLACVPLPNTAWRSIVTEAWLFIGGLIAGLVSALVSSRALSKKTRLPEATSANQAPCAECKQLFRVEDMILHH